MQVERFRSVPLTEAIPRWDFELRMAAAFLPEDPLHALEWSRRIDREIAAEIELHRGSEAELAQLRWEAHALVEASAASSRKFLEESERRQRAFEAREHAVFDHPLRSLREPRS